MLKIKKMGINMTNIILCGGSGTRLWPISRSLMPKQFIKLFDDKSLFQLTLERNNSICNNHLIVSNTEQYFLAFDQIEELGFNQSKFLLEPIGRNTAPAIALACLSLNIDEVVLVSPSDHIIKDEDSYNKALARAIELAQEDNLVTFGIEPEFAEVGFGYIEADGEDVKSFREKPNKTTAQKYVDAGNYYWNSGMFCFKAGVFLEELKKYAQDIYQSAEKAYNNLTQNTIMRVSYDDMIAIPQESIDYAVIEKSNKVKVVASKIGWSDLGSFDTLSDEYNKDKNGNTKDENIISINSNDNFVYTSNRVVALASVNDLIVVDTPDALLISSKGNSQQVKEIVSKLKSKGSQLHHVHLTAHRPWGTYSILEENENYKIKRIVVKSGKRLSLQKHYHRSEHWIVVSGTALVTIGERETLIKPNESTYIPIGQVHRLENPGKIDVVLIEVQVGDYLDEDDIVRLDDDFERF